jgi:hypothetical protein
MMQTDLPIDLGLVTSIPTFFSQGMFGDQQDQTQAIRIQMETLGGKRYFVSPSVDAARSMILGLANWPPMQDFLSGQEPPVPTKLQ